MIFSFLDLVQFRQPSSNNQHSWLLSLIFRILYYTSRFVHALLKELNSGVFRYICGMSAFKINRDKVINSLLYIVNQIPGSGPHQTFKVLYFAEQKHLVKYGRPITGDMYVKMVYGPVPSYSRDVTGNNIPDIDPIVVRSGHSFRPLMEPDFDQLSETDIECLEESIAENKNLSFPQLTDKSHDHAYHTSMWQINPLDIARAGGATEEMLQYISFQIENDQIVR